MHAHTVVLSVVIPFFNEKTTLQDCVQSVLAIEDRRSDLNVEIILVDDGSSDGSHRVALQLQKNHEQVSLICLPTNLGKGAAVRRGLCAANGHLIAIQDADLEYKPNDLLKLIEPLIEDQADVVFGSRFQNWSLRGKRTRQVIHFAGNRFLTALSNFKTGLKLTDMETCYKVFQKKVIDEILPQMKENRFAIEPEMTALISKIGYRVTELPVSYNGRGYREGKKIGFVDGLSAIYCILVKH
ncbi:MAG: glycosyltransferase family 2 protein [Planctomycetota bacterium]